MGKIIAEIVAETEIIFSTLQKCNDLTFKNRAS